MTYSIEDIKTAESLLTFPVNKFFKWYTTDSIYSILDSNFPNTDAHIIINLMLSIDSAYGKIDNLGFGGWATSFIKETHQPLKAFYITAFNGQYMTDYLIAVLPDTKKIAAVRMLDRPHR
jgi:hypothetical protein